MQVRNAAVAGMFYPDQPAVLSQQLQQLLKQSTRKLSDAPLALVVPHAGYIYSGATAAAAYNLIPEHTDYDYILLIGPSHRVALQGMAAPTAESFATPLGHYPLAKILIEKLNEEGLFVLNDTAHQLEHSLEVQLPFLQQQQLEIPLIPVVVGHEQAEKVAELIERVSREGKVLILISSDLSHFHDYDEACQIDSETSQRILALDHHIQPQQACGCFALNGLLLWLQRKGLEISLVEQCNSGDTAGDKSRVVGYGSYVVYP